MRILTLVRSLAKGGTQRVAQNFAQAYRDLGHDSRLIATQEGGVREAELAAHGVGVWLSCAAENLAAMREWGADVVHIHSHGPTEPDVRAVLAVSPSARVIETNVFARPSPWIDAVDVSLQLSTWCRWMYHRRTSGMHAPAAVVPNAVNVAGFRRAGEVAVAAFRDRHGVRPDELLLGRVGQADDSKWSPLLVEALEWLHGRGVAAKLVVVNAPPSILERCRRSPCSAAVIAIDQVIGDDKLSEVYSATDVFVHAADGGESFGLVLAEAMLCETPAVALSTPWNDNSQGEVVGNGVGGFVATTRRGFFAALATLAGDPALRRNLGSAGRARVLARFDSRELARSALGYATGTFDAAATRPPDRAAILALYRQAFDAPSWLTCVLVGRLPRLQLTRYTTGYQPWSDFVARAAGFAGRRCRRLGGTGPC